MPPIDHGHQRPHARGNTGAGLRLGILDLPPHDFHETRMGSLVSRVAPGAEIVWGDAADPGDLWRLAAAGCAVIALPFVLPGVVSLPDWDRTLGRCAQAGVLLFAGTGNGVPTTQYPASHPLVFACGGVSATDGTPVPRWSSAGGDFDVGVVSGDAASSGATVLAAAMSLLWLGHAIYTHSHPSHRRPGFGEWLTRTGTALVRGYAPNCSTL